MTQTDSPPAPDRTEKVYSLGEAARRSKINPILFRHLLLAHKVPVYRRSSGTRVVVPESSIREVRRINQELRKLQHAIVEAPADVRLD